MLLPIPALMQAPEAQQADLALVLAVDTSASVDTHEFRLQMRGTADALTDPAVLDAIARGQHGAIAIALVQWSSLDEQAVSLDWTLIRNDSDAAAAARTIRRTPRLFGFRGTAVADALNFSMGLFATLPFNATRWVIDISGDGRNAHPPLLLNVRRRAVETGITINGLPIISTDPTIHFYYEDTVIVGPGAFIEIAESYDDIGRAMRRKLIREIMGPPPISMLAD